MDCKYCNSACSRAGHSRSGIQRYHCRDCKRYQQGNYVQHARSTDINGSIAELLTEGLAIRGIARILKISITTVVSRIKTIANSTVRPHSVNQHGIFEIDELWTFVGSKDNATWITYALDRSGKQVIDFAVGSRTRELLSRVTTATLALSPSKVCTDGLPVYRSLIPNDLHRVGLPHTSCVPDVRIIDLTS